MPEQKKIRVEFELPADTVQDLIRSGKRAGREITEKELDELAKAGAIRASEYLDAAQTAEVVAAIPKFIKKVVNKISSPKVQTVVAQAVTAAVTARLEAEDEEETENTPKQ